MKTLRIFVSSPGDVKEEREFAIQIIRSLNPRYARQFLLEPVFWEHMPLKADLSFQQEIESILSDEQGIDIALFILWSRFGSRLGPAICKPDGSEYRSGTEREFDIMIQAAKQSRAQTGQPKPQILMYIRDDKAGFDERLKGKSIDEQKALIEQMELVEKFKRDVLADPENGVNLGAHHPYAHLSDFREKLRAHLSKLLDKLDAEAPEKQQPVWNTDTNGPPFVALDAFQPEQANIFFGREDEIINACQAFHKQKDKGYAFVLLCGASGSGKSSLARAGVLPCVISNERSKENPVWRTLILKPSELVSASNPPSSSLIGVFVEHLVKPEVLPELLAPGISQSDLADILCRSPDDAVKHRFKPALIAIGQRQAETTAVSANHPPSARLFLLIDQLEELFTITAISDADCGAFLAVLEAFAKSRDVWVLTTVRSDFYQKVQEKPELMRMKGNEGEGMIDVLPPDTGALRRIIEEPARLAGIKFQKDEKSQQYLSDKILKDAASHSELLPLVEYVLWDLYSKASMRKQNVLRFDDYRSPGDPDDYNGVESALIKRADAVFSALWDKTVSQQPIFATHEEAEQAFDRVFKSLVTINEGMAGNNELVVRRYSPLKKTFPENTALRNMVDAFVQARLFTTSKAEESGEAIVAVAHESLLRIWPRAKKWVDGHRDLLLIRSRMDARLKEGVKLLESGPLLIAAKDKYKKNPTDFSEEQCKLIVDSIHYHQRRKWAILATILLVIGTIIYTSYRQRQVAQAGQLFAEAERDLFQKDYAHAEIAASKALTLEDSPETRKLLLKIRSGGIKLLATSDRKMPGAALSQFSRDGELVASVFNGKKGKPAEVVIQAMNGGLEKWTIVLPPSKNRPDAMAFSENNGQTRLLAIAGQDFSVGLWRLPKGKPAELFRELSNDKNKCRHQKRIPSLAFHPTESWIVTSSEDKRLCLWDYSGSQEKFLIKEITDAHGTAVHGIAFNKDGSLLASGGGDYEVKIWKTTDLAAGHDVEPIKTLKGHTDSVFAVAFSPDGKKLASGGYDRTVRIWNIETENAQNTSVNLNGHESTIMDVAFSDDSKLLISSGKDEAARIWDLTEGRMLATVKPDDGIIRSVAWRSFEDDIRLGGEKGWSIWSLHNRKIVERFWNGGASVAAIAFDPAGRFFAAAGDDGKVRIWNSENHAVKELDSLLEGEEFNSLTISPDSLWLAAGGEGKTVHLWKHGKNWDSWEKITPADKHLLTHEGAIWGLCFDAQGRWLYSGNADKNMQITRWKTSDRTFTSESTKLEDSVYALACDPGGKRIISGDSNGTVKVWDVGHLEKPVDCIHNVIKGERNVWSIALSSAPSYIFSGNSDGYVRRWIADETRRASNGNIDPCSTTENVIKSQNPNANPTINSVSYNQKRGWVAAGGDGNSIEIYDAELKHVQSLTGHDGTVWYVTFDPEGRRLAYGGLDRILRVVDIDELLRFNSAAPEELYRESREMTGLSIENTEKSLREMIMSMQQTDQQ